jgi:hypothetical protein
MGRSHRDERQVLDAGEIALIEASHHPRLGETPDKELHELRKLIRDRRDRARDIAARQRREMRGKADPRGARPAADNTGTRKKRDVLAAAMQRINREATRRETKAARDDMKDSVSRALEMRRAKEAQAARFGTRTANEGMRVKGSSRAFERNRAKLGAVSQHNKNMQAKRDNSR